MIAAGLFLGSFLIMLGLLVNVRIISFGVLGWSGVFIVMVTLLVAALEAILLDVDEEDDLISAGMRIRRRFTRRGRR